MSLLFSDFSLGAARLRNRLAVAPMTTSQSNPDGSPSEAEARWLERLVDDEYGIVVTCAAAISRTSIAFHNQLSFGDDAFLPALTALATRLARPGSLVIAQLCHGGSRAIPSLAGQPAHSASRYELPVPGFVPPIELSTPQIERIVEEFAVAASRAARAGFGGVELHGANGYLFTQFTSTMTNRRSDGWGVSLENRARFSREVVRAVRARVPRGFVVGYRMSFENFGLETGLDIDENVRVMRWLAEDGIDYGHVSSLDFAAPSVKYPDRLALSHIRAGIDRALPLMCAGGVRRRGDADRALELGADLVAIGRAAVGNARVPDKLAQDVALAATPFARASLDALSVSQDFIRYMTTAIPVSSLNIVAPE
jgi:2,4-dienoyl-CoA reductase-like NADH-dependent reductase (Old Yellow Enzyme family)